MESKELIDIWKKDIDNKIPDYYTSELEKVILSKNKKNFRSIFPAYILVMLTLGILLFSSLLFMVNGNKDVILYLSALILLFLYGMFLWIRSYKKINQSNRDRTIKEWLRFRIEEIEKKVKPENKVFVPRFILIIISLFIIFREHYMVVIIAGIISPLQLLYNNRKLKKQLKQLKELYELLEDKDSIQ